MRIIDGAKLFEKLEEKGLTDKTVRLFSLDDLRNFAEILGEHVDGYALPYFDKLGRLCIPLNSPKKMRFWESSYGVREKFEALREMGVSDEKMPQFIEKHILEMEGLIK